MKRRYFTLISHVSLLSLFLLSKLTVFASDLSVEFPNQPLFTIQNMAPGDGTEKRIQVQNTSSSPQQVSIKVKKEGGSRDLESVLMLTISEGLTYFKKITMKEALSISNGPIGIPLLTLDPQEKKDLIVNVLFDPLAGNSYQQASFTFAITFQSTGGIPTECKGIPNLSTPIEGTAKSDRLNGTTGNDLIIGNAGNDIIDGKGGNDCILAGEGRDIINGGTGHDVIIGQEGNDLLRGGAGDDSLYGNSGLDVLQGEQGDDRLTGDALDILIGGVNKDVCIGSLVKISCES